MPEKELPEIKVKLKKEKPEIIGMLEKDMPDEEEENKLDFLEKGSEKKPDDKKAGKVSRKNSLADNNLQNARPARDFIVELRDKGFETRNSSYFTDKVKEDYGNKFLKIIAARQLADSERNNPERLKTVSITAEQLDQRVAEMKEDAVFKGFIDSIKKSKSKMISAITRATATPGHGGKLDDMLKKYMLNLPPGELKNSKLHERYMPSVDERIEKIKEQVEKLQSKNTTSKKEDEKIKDQLVKAVAEIIELRNLSQAEYGKKESLAKKIPCDQNVLESKINALANDGAFRSTALDRNVQKLLVAKGHGGKMTVKVRELYSQNLEKKAGISEILEENTIQARMKQMKKKAGEIAESLGKAQPGSDIQNDQAKAGKELMEEYYLLYAQFLSKAADIVSSADNLHIVNRRSYLAAVIVNNADRIKNGSFLVFLIRRILCIPDFADKQFASLSAAYHHSALVFRLIASRRHKIDKCTLEEETEGAYAADGNKPVKGCIAHRNAAVQYKCEQAGRAYANAHSEYAGEVVLLVEVTP